jgi:hypothetical protein
METKQCPMCPFTIVYPEPRTFEDAFDTVHAGLKLWIRHEQAHVEDFQIEMELMSF